MMVFSIEVLRASCTRRCMDHSNDLRNQKCADTISLKTFERGGIRYDGGNIIVQAGQLIFRVFRGMLAELSPLLQELLSPQKISTSFNLFVTRAGFGAIVAAFRFGTTCEIQGVPRNALTLLFDVYPSNFADFVDVGLDPSYCRDHIIPVIEFAREHSIDWILPFAFHCFFFKMTGWTLHRRAEYGGAPVVLSIEDQERCYDPEKIMRSVSGAAVLERYSSRVSDVGCMGSAECQASCLVEGAGLCPRTECLQDMKGWDLDYHQSLWNDLPGLFGLPDWTVLNRIRDTALRDSEHGKAITF
ncbi:hypothetical protein K438DRAFT_1889583 [Mycena galopus ATCC 62051]|nr:hypothetical protein K438DRAFT_1889583 [Mycena galopus ATCC 62051]